MSAAVLLLVLRVLLLRLLATFPAGLQVPAPDGSVPRRTSTTTVLSPLLLVTVSALSPFCFPFSLVCEHRAG